MDAQQIEMLLGVILYYVMPVIVVLLLIYIVMVLDTVRQIKEISRLNTGEASVFGRDSELAQLFRNISKGQSTAIFGVFDREKTQILNFLRNSGSFDRLYGPKAKNLIFSYVDIAEFSQRDLGQQKRIGAFWKLILLPVKEDEKDEKLSELYQSLVDNDDEVEVNYQVEKIILQLNSKGKKLVLLADNFDILFLQKQLSREFRVPFFGQLRNLVSISPQKSFTIVTTSTNDFTKNPVVSYDHSGSYLFSYFITINLSTSTTIVDSTFPKNIYEIAGFYPFLIKQYKIIQELNPSSTKQELENLFVKRVKEQLEFILKQQLILDCGSNSSIAVELRNFQGGSISKFLQSEFEALGLLRQMDSKYQVNPPCIVDLL